ncbi:hypothetical protein [Celeribacter halophilus]|uniref:hypothetical protein n=1 Tax=Celeribacter halophilus TaxID=576117 RepID=UPI003A9204E6
MLPDGQKQEVLQREVTLILESEAFARSKANRALLEYLAKECLAGRGDEITEYGIAHGLLGRGDEFDPSTDPIVRVRMRRLREAINGYYAQHDDRVDRLNIPRGSYALSVLRVEQPSAPERQAEDAAVDEIARADEAGADGPAQPPSDTHTPDRPKMRKVFGLRFVLFLIVAFATGVLGHGIWHEVVPSKVIETAGAEPGYPVVAIAPFDNLTDQAENDAYEKDVQRQLAGDLERFGRVNVRVLNADLNSELEGADYVLRGSILSLAGHLDLSVALVDVETGEELFQTRMSDPVDAQGIYASLRAVSHRISSYLAAQGGVISALGRPDVGAASAQDNVFSCVLQTDAFLNDYSPEKFQTAYRCFAPFSDILETDAVGSTSFGTLMLHSVPDFQFMDTSGLPEVMQSSPEKLTEYAEGLADRFPGSDVVFILLGAVYNVEGKTDLAIRALRQAVELNPANPTAYGVLSYAYLSADRLYDARDAALRAIDLSANASAYMYLPVLVSGIVHKNARMVDMARKGYADQVGPSRNILLLAAASMIGDRDEVERLRALVGRLDDPLAEIRMFVQGDIALSAIAGYLERAGLDVPVPECLPSETGSGAYSAPCAP